MKQCWQRFLVAIVLLAPLSWARANNLIGEDVRSPTLDEAIQLVAYADWDNQQRTLNF